MITSPYEISIRPISYLYNFNLVQFNSFQIKKQVRRPRTIISLVCRLELKHE
jgi:hypothetical protein